jgi:hypothetical protein
MKDVMTEMLMNLGHTMNKLNGEPGELLQCEAAPTIPSRAPQQRNNGY